MIANWPDRTEESKRNWNLNADFWDNYMGDDDNRFHREIIIPETLKLLEPIQGQRILDIGCGNGNFSRRLARVGLIVVAFDFSEKMIQNAIKRSQEMPSNPTYIVLDATDAQKLQALGKEMFDSAVANMSLMDMSDIYPLACALQTVLKPGGRFVFSVMHPCFQPPGLRKVVEEREVGNEVQLTRSIIISSYIRSEPFEGVGIRNQPEPSLYFHRPLSELLDVFFEIGFRLDGIAEPVFTESAENKGFDWFEIPPVLILRMRNQNRE
ncbi:MAG: class I SAM-dependent methyltransferase [Candidatus Sumerlaeota bacterium]|nr:class I SAM-dependent methyltransferase [Candidatus Sumerlaeota bacterium]